MKIGVRQICFIMAAYTVVQRLLLYPVELASGCGRDLLVPAFINFLLEGIAVWSVSYLCSRTDCTFVQLLKRTFGNIAARVVMGLFALYFLSCALYPLLEQKLYVHAIFYDTVPSLLVFLPFFFFSVYAASKNFTNIGRSADICFPIFVLSLGAILAMSVGEAEWGSLLPVLKTPPADILKGVAGTFFRFSEAAVLMMFMGRFEYKKGDAARITLSYALGAAVVLLFLAVFYGIYGEIAQTRHFAVARISLFFPAIDTIGRVDLLALYLLETVMLFSLVLYLQLAVYCIAECSGYKNTLVLSFAVNAVMLAALFALNSAFGALHAFFTGWLWLAALLFSFAAPFLVWALKRRENE